MHKGIILLLKIKEDLELKKQLKIANGKIYLEIESRVKDFLAPYWDWFAIGGRWTGTLSGYDPNFDTKHDGDIMPLKDCIKIVKEWHQDTDKEFEKRSKEAEKEYGKTSGKYDKSMYAYTLKNALDILREEFCFECNVYNVEEQNYSIPENLDGWYAVIVDLHN